MPRPQTQSEAFATGYEVALQALPTPITPDDAAHYRATWTRERNAAPTGPLRWGLDGMLAALRAVTD